MIPPQAPGQPERSPLLPLRAPEGHGGPDVPGAPVAAFPRVTRAKKSIFVNRLPGAVMDQTVISSRFYDGFNYTLEGQNLEGTSLVLGVTSANPGEGKTLVAANFAVSLALSTERRTVLVDLHGAQPRLHTLFGVPQGPGLLESLGDDSIEVWETPVPHLNLLTAGAGRTQSPSGAEGGSSAASTTSKKPILLQLDDLGRFRDVFASLREAFEFLVLDFPCLRGNQLPTVFSSEIDGFVVVVQKERTKMEEVTALVRRIDQQRLLGFVINQAATHSRKRWYR